MYEVIETGAAPIKAWIKDVPVEVEAKKQLENIARLPFVFRHVAAMPDVHLGKGATVGSVIATKAAIVPAAVGVDIGCGMAAVMTNITAAQLPDSLARIRSDIEAAVPLGPNSHKHVTRHADAAWLGGLKSGWEAIDEKHPGIAKKEGAAKQIGTLGGGNHFIELCLDEADRLWIMLHSGSRNVGNRIGAYFIDRAKEEIAKTDIRLADKDLAWLDEGTPLFGDYVEAVGWAQNYARTNREAMMAAVLSVLKQHWPDLEITELAVNCHHNYVQQEQHFGEMVWLTRKGAVRAGAGELGIIPGSMGTRSYIVRGKGNAESFESCSHGAGRTMSRTAARRQFTLADHERATRGVECRKDGGVLDETPMAYKDIDTVMAAQTDLVDVAHTLHQIVCVKG